MCGCSIKPHHSMTDLERLKQAGCNCEADLICIAKPYCKPKQKVEEVEDLKRNLENELLLGPILRNSTQWVTMD